MRFEQAIQPFAGQPLTQQILMDVLKDYRWPHNKTQELVRQEMLIPIKRGLYITGPELNFPRPSNFLLANHLYGPSYVSLETALSYWGLIPEKVVATTSMTTGASRVFRTPVGRFQYIHAKLPYYSFGQQMVRVGEKQNVLMASKEKALCDKLITGRGILLRSVQQALAWLLEDVRMEREQLRAFNTRVMAQWTADSPKQSSLNILIKTIQRL